MTSSLRNSLHRRNHKERSQLAHRTRFGILEKHADYVQRARDYHSKQDRLTRLRQKAVDRNKDEFYFSMNKERTKGGVHVKDRGNTSLPIDMVKVLKTQDENYVRTMRTAGLKKIDKIKGQLTALADLVRPSSLEFDGRSDQDGLDETELEILREAGVISAPKGRNSASRKLKHIVFVENNAQARDYVVEKKKSSKVPKEDVNRDVSAGSTVDLGWKIPDEQKKRRKHNAKGVMDSGGVDEQAAIERKELAVHHRKRLLKELSARLFRDKQLRYAEREFEMQRLMMGSGGRRKLTGVEKVEGDHEDDKEDEDELDARKGKARSDGAKVVDEKLWKPRVYKWRLERKR